jgi:hypothetical protein
VPVNQDRVLRASVALDLTDDRTAVSMFKVVLTHEFGGPCSGPIAFGDDFFNRIGAIEQRTGGVRKVRWTRTGSGKSGGRAGQSGGKEFRDTARESMPRACMKATYSDDH